MWKYRIKWGDIKTFGKSDLRSIVKAIDVIVFVSENLNLEKDLTVEFNQISKRYCKGCLLEVTNFNWCFCGEFNLTEDGMYTEKDLKELNL